MTDDRDLRGRDGRSGAEPTDEMVSAYIDGEATPAEAARVEADPALVAWAAELRGVAAAVGRRVDPPPVETRDRQIEAALAVLGRPGNDLVDLAAERERRARLRRRVWAASVAAVVLLMAVVAVPLLSRLGTDASSDVATVQDRESAGQAAGDDGAPTSSPTAPGGDAGGGPVTESAGEGAAPLPSIVRLGSFADEDELLRAVRQARAQSAAPEATTDSTLPLVPGGVVCPPPADRAAQPSASYVAAVAGSPVTVYVYAVGPSESVLVLDATCEVVRQTDL